MITIFIHEHGDTRSVDAVDPAWLRPDSQARVWVDLAAPTPEESRVLVDPFHFHELAVEDALSEIHHPKVEEYDGYLYLILHGIDFQASEHEFATHDVDFFVSANYLVTVHDGTSRSIERLREVCPRSDHILGEGPVALLHRIVDAMVDNYRPEVEKLEDKLNILEDEVFANPDPQLLRQILALKRDVSSLRRVTTPQRDAVGRLARREYPLIDEALAYRFRDVHDHLVRLADEALALHDRITGLLEAHLSSVSNRLNQVMKVLTLIATIFMPLTVLTGMFGMNVRLPAFPGGEWWQFWWIFAVMVAIGVGMGLLFRGRRWV